MTIEEAFKELKENAQNDEIKEKEERKRKGIINIFDLIGDENE